MESKKNNIKRRLKMDVMKYCQSYLFITEGISEKVEQKVESLLKTLFTEKDDYQKEKFIKIFCEYLTYFEEVLCYKHGIHPNQIPYNSASMGHEKYIQKIEEVKNMMESRIERLSEHVTVFMEF
jgi:hypothetical protein